MSCETIYAFIYWAAQRAEQLHPFASQFAKCCPGHPASARRYASGSAGSIMFNGGDQELIFVEIELVR